MQNHWHITGGKKGVVTCLSALMALLAEVEATLPRSLYASEAQAVTEALKAAKQELQGAYDHLRENMAA